MRAILCMTALMLFGVSPAQKKEDVLKYHYSSATKGKGPQPLVVLLHGYGSDDKDLFSLHFPPKFHVISLRAPFALSQGGNAWFGLEFLANQQFRYNYAQAQQSGKKIMRTISWACREFGADSSRVVVVGFSQGAMMAYELALGNPGKLHGIAALSGGIIPDSKRYNLRTSIRGFPVFIAHGTADEVVRYSFSEDAAKYLRDQGAEVTFKAYRQPHNISQAELLDLRDWLESVTVKK